MTVEATGVYRTTQEHCGGAALMSADTDLGTSLRRAMQEAEAGRTGLRL